MYRIVQLDSQWVIYVGPAMLLAFDRMDAAIKTVHDAENLMNAVRAPTLAPPPDFAVRMAEAAQRHLDSGPELQTAPAFVERRRTSRISQYAEVDAAE
jgi:hypothetical protein